MEKLSRGERFQDARLVHNKHGKQTQRQVAEETNLESSFLSNVENDDCPREPGINKVKALAEYYCVSIDWLLGLSEVPRVDPDLKMICDYTGLSDSNVRRIKEIKDGGYSFDIGLFNDVFDTSNIYKMFEAIDRVFKTYRMINQILSTYTEKINSAQQSECPNVELDDLLNGETESINSLKSKWELSLFHLDRVCRELIPENIREETDEKIGAIERQIIRAKEEFYSDMRKGEENAKA